jgi:hypothetical protein
MPAKSVQDALRIEGGLNKCAGDPDNLCPSFDDPQIETARVVGYAPGLGSLIKREE